MQSAVSTSAPRASIGLVLSALRYPNYRLYWIGQVVSVIGMTMDFVALGWLVYSLTNSPLSLGATGLAQSLPRIGLVLVGGAVADRVDRRRLLVLTQGICALLYCGLALLVIADQVQLWHVLACAFIFGCLRAFDNPSRQALLPHLIPREDLPNAVALGNLAWEVPRLGGPALAGVLIAALGVGPTLYVEALAFGFAMVLFSRIRIEKALRTEQTQLLSSLVGGINYIRQEQIFGLLIGMVFFNSVFGMSYQVLLPIFARDVLQVGSQGFGLLQTSAAVGGVMGSLGVAALARTGRRGWFILGGSLAYGVGLMGFALSPWFGLSAFFLMLAGLANNVYMTAIATTLQMRVPDDYRARVMGVYSLTWSLQPLGAMITGTVAELAGAPTAVAAAAALVVGLALLLGTRSSQMRKLN